MKTNKIELLAPAGDMEKLKALVGENNVDDNCIAQCGDEFTAFINDELVQANSEEEFFAMVKERM